MVGPAVARIVDGDRGDIGRQPVGDRFVAPAGADGEHVGDLQVVDHVAERVQQRRVRGQLDEGARTAAATARSNRTVLRRLVYQ